MERTSWIDMQRIHGSKVFVAGAGALGNEVLKDLALAGFRDLTVADPDTVEESNLSRCILFRDRHIGRNKAEVASESVAEIDPCCSTTPIPERIQGVDLSRFDIVVGCLDSISARLHLNSYACMYRIPYVDGATDGFNGKVQVIFSGRPCMECGMNRTHLDELHRSFSCDPGKSGLVRDPVILSSGITTTAVIAAMCVREVIKIVCGMEGECINGICHYNGMKGTAEVYSVDLNPDCPNHGDELCRLI